MLAEDQYEHVKDEKGGQGAGFSLDTDSENEDNFIGVNVDLAQVDEKASAVNALG